MVRVIPSPLHPIQARPGSERHTVSERQTLRWGVTRQDTSQDTSQDTTQAETLEPALLSPVKWTQAQH